MKKLLLLALWFAVAPPVRAEQAMIERWDRAVCLHTERKFDDGLQAVASGFIVETDARLYLVTARHVAKQTNTKTRIVYRAPSGESRWVRIGGLTQAGTDPWFSYENADLSIARLHEHAESSRYLQELREVAVPLASISTESPSRTTQIEITGFPMALGMQPTVSPLAMIAHVSSKEHETAAQWGKETVIYAVPTVANGSSGGPVFLSRPDSLDVITVGMYVGFMADGSGAKLSKIIPGRIISAAVQKLDDSVVSVADAEG